MHSNAVTSDVILIDTDVFSALVVNNPRRNNPNVTLWREMLSGRHTAVSFQTRAEVLCGILALGERKATQIKHSLDELPCARVDWHVIDVFAELTAAGNKEGNALGAKIHTGDRWIAATAIAYDLKLLSGDGIFTGAPGLKMLTD